MADISGIPEESVPDQDDDIRDRASTSPTLINTTRKRGTSNASEAISAATVRLRSATNSILEANVPVGMWSATGKVVSQAPTPADIRRGSFSSRRESDVSGTKARSDSQTSDMREETNGRGSRATSQPVKLDKIQDDDGFPNDVFGRPEIEDQSFVRGQRASIGGRIPKIAVRGKDIASPSSENFTDAMELQDSQTNTNSQPFQSPTNQSTEPFPELEDSDLDEIDPRPKRKSKNVDAMLGRGPTQVIARESSEPDDIKAPVPNDEGIYPNGYSFPKKKPWGEATKIGFMAFLRFTFTPLGFLIVLYGLNVVAWGGMLFLLLCNASPAMCTLGDGRYDCNDIDSPRRVWVEIDSQILNALFCVTGFGLIPWRFRDLWYWWKWRVGKNPVALRKLAGYHNGWFRLPGSDQLPVRDFRESDAERDILNPALPFPLKKTPAPPLTGARAPAVPFWKLDFVIWAFVWNTFLQIVLSCFMWALNRYDRPSWSTGLFVALACIVAAAAGLVQFLEGKKIKAVEGVPLEVAKEYEDVEASMEKNKNKDIKGAEKITSNEAAITTSAT